jgi:hypothetical protein
MPSATSRSQRADAADGAVHQTQETGAVAPHAQRSVVHAFLLGWNVAELFHARIPRSTPVPPERPEKLPGRGDLDDLAQALLLLNGVAAGAHRVCRIEEWGGLPERLATLRTLLGADTRDPGVVRTELLALHREVLSGSTAADARLGTAYGLGRALAETTLLPSGRDRETLAHSFQPFRIAQMETWLSDLKSLLPAHAAEGVRRSLRRWAAWVRQPIMAMWSEGRRQVVGHRPVDWESPEDQERITRALRRQGQVWRGLLSGEKGALDLLSAEDYVGAAESLVGRLGTLTGWFVRRHWILLLAAGAASAAVLVLLAILSQIALAAVGLGAVAAAVGIAWKGCAATLGKAMTRAERPLWEAALDTRVGIAATRLPRAVVHGVSTVGDAAG